MLCEKTILLLEGSPKKVLILVLMEDALRGPIEITKINLRNGLNPCSNGRCSARTHNDMIEETFNVLILVLMEDALRVPFLVGLFQAKRCLNPCSNGRCSASPTTSLLRLLSYCLNPCSNGRCSASKEILIHC